LRQVAAAGGLADAEAEVTAFAEDPAAYQPARREGVLAGVLARARAALARRALPEAMALANRAAALAPHDAAVESLVAEIAAGGRRRRTAAVAGAAIAVGTAVAATWAAVGLGDGSSRVAVRLPDARVDADAGIDSGPEISGAGPDQVRIDAGSVIEDAPYAGADAALEGGSLARLIDAGRLLPRHRSLPQHVSFDAGSSPTIAPLVPDAAPPADEPVAAPLPARLTLVMDAWCDVSVDGVDHGRADRRRPIVLPAGPHRVVCRQGPGLGGWSDLLTLTPGEDRTVTGSVLRPVVVIVGVEGGDAVAIDGKAYRRGATARLRPGRYRVAITRGGREVTAGWVSVPRVESCALRDVPELDCYQ